MPRSVLGDTAKPRKKSLIEPHDLVYGHQDPTATAECDKPLFQLIEVACEWSHLSPAV